MCLSHRILSAVFAVWAVLLLHGSVFANGPIMRLRIAWGDGSPRQWQARFSLSEGTFDDPHLLGLEADEPGSLRVTDKGLEIWQRSPRSYDGVDVEVWAEPDAQLQFELIPLDEPAAATSGEVELRELIAGYHSAPLDERRNRLLVRRAPGDKLRVNCNTERLVFAPGEIWTFDVEPHLMGLPEKTALRIQVELRKSASQQVVWKEEFDRAVEANGDTQPLPTSARRLPSEEGIYELLITATKRQLRPTFLGAKPFLQRRVQFAIVDPQPRTQPFPTVAAEPALEVDIDPTNSAWWKRLTRLPQLAVIPGWGKGPLGNEKTEEINRLGRRFVGLKPGGWQAYPLPISHPGQPHILQIEYPNDVRQTLGISFIEPDATGNVVPLQIDSGIDVPPLAAGNEAAVEVHQLPVWPRTKAPLLLLTNRREDGPAVYGRIRIYQGLGPSLPPPQPAGLPSRLAAAFYDKPLLGANFSATKPLDPWTQRAQDDWTTFYQGGKRLVAYLQYAGQNAAVIPVVCEGSGIYPSDLLQPTPRFDTGTFFGQGQDPVRKDVLELLLRLFDQQQLTLLPSVQFTAPLPELEKQLDTGENTDGIECVGGDGRTWLQIFGSRRGLAPYYNPLDKRVQTAMVAVVRELVDRYGHHPSFGGVVLTLRPDGYTQLPGPSWGFDDQTIARFTRDTKLAVPTSEQHRFAARQRFLLDDEGNRRKWLAWRADQLATLYQKMQDEVTRANPAARLYLEGSALLTSPVVETAMYPALPRPRKLADALLQLGVDPARYREEDGIVLLRPHRFAPRQSLVQEAVNHEIETTPAVDRLFEANVAGSVFYHEPLPLRLAEFDAVSPFGRDKTRTQLFSQIPSAGDARRKRLIHSLASLDSQIIFDGGQLLPLGQEHALRDVLDTFLHLPAGCFETVQVKPAIPGIGPQPVVMRKRSTAEATYIYLVNDSPWPAQVDMKLEVTGRCVAEPLGQLKLQSQRAPVIRGNQATWSLALRPYDLVGAVLSSPKVEVEELDVTVSGDVIAHLRESIRSLGERADSLKTSTPFVALANEDFELEETDGQIPGWRHAVAPGIDVSLDPGQGRNGNALKLSSNGGVVWVRSDPIEVPKTGRLHVAAWLRTADAAQQPILRLAVDGEHLDRPPYRYAVVGAGTSQPLRDQWELFVFQVNDLPVDGWQRLEVGFDLMGSGEVWIDEVRIYDKRFNPDEQRHLSNAWVAVAGFHLREGKLGDCQRLLESYWPQFLLTHVPPPNLRVARAPRPVGRAATPPPAPDDQEEDKPNRMIDRVRDRLKFW
jgi:hypothetical protein